MRGPDLHQLQMPASSFALGKDIYLSPDQRYSGLENFLKGYKECLSTASPVRQMNWDIPDYLPDLTDKMPDGS
ncbi:hypothetical protein RRG08_062868 [Elysia crispata]|uniref:Uncharacterized protein n=1 Tax=Elysia crispata TaxID=231223 RepID=A0AAE0YD78_9GAST|nr:hypothetical protein RRG08_062868 [Elysia crispata]